LLPGDIDIGKPRPDLNHVHVYLRHCGFSL
jgi:hypothetical protein